MNKEKLIKNIAFEKIIRHTNNISGEDFEFFWADCIGGKRLSSSQSLVDVVKGDTSWEVKTIICKSNSLSLVYGRIISQTNNMKERLRIIQNTWNDRLNKIKNDFKESKSVIFIRDVNLEWVGIITVNLELLNIENYEWDMNNKGVISGYQNNRKRIIHNPSGGQYRKLIYRDEHNSDRLIIPKLNKTRDEIIDSLM
jgi:hypothetical protein